MRCPIKESLLAALLCAIGSTGRAQAPPPPPQAPKPTKTLRAISNFVTLTDQAMRPPKPERTDEFRRILTEKGLLAFVRYSRGQDIMAACGQLALLESIRQPSAPPATA